MVYQSPLVSSFVNKYDISLSTQTNKQTNRQTDRQTNTHTHTRTHTHTHTKHTGTNTMLLFCLIIIRISYCKSGQDLVRKLMSAIRRLSWNTSGQVNRMTSEVKGQAS